MVTKKQAEDSVQVKLKGQYATTNKMLFTGAGLLDGQVAEFSLYVNKSVADKELQGATFFVELDDLEQARTPKSKKK